MILFFIQLVLLYIIYNVVIDIIDAALLDWNKRYYTLYLPISYIYVYCVLIYKMYNRVDRCYTFKIKLEKIIMHMYESKQMKYFEI